MGNRATLKFQDEADQPNIYLHWHGGRASVQAFLNVAKAMELEADSYGLARMCQIIGNFFGGNSSIGCENNLGDYGDNGIYLIKNFEIIGREKFNGKEEIDEEKTKSITNFIIDLHKKLAEARKELRK